VAVHTIKSNKGGRTPGIDGATYSTPAEINDLLDEVADALNLGYVASPVKRVMIPKPGTSEMRPLGVLTVKDRVIQMLWKFAVEPIAEVRGDATSWGGRPFRSAQDAQN
jgi:RNA-directed DNA polymerase